MTVKVALLVGYEADDWTTIAVVLDNYQMNPGTNSPFATASINYFGNGQYVNTTPEPMTMGMMGAGLLALGLLRRKSA